MPANGAVIVPVMATVALPGAVGWLIASPGTGVIVNARVAVWSESVAGTATSTAVDRGLVVWFPGLVTTIVLGAASAGMAVAAIADPKRRTEAVIRRIRIRFVFVDLRISAPVVSFVTRGTVVTVIYTVRELDGNRKTPKRGSAFT